MSYVIPCKIKNLYTILVFFKRLEARTNKELVKTQVIANVMRIIFSVHYCEALRILKK